MPSKISVNQVDQIGYAKALEQLKPGLARPLHFLHSPKYGQWQEAAGKPVCYFTVSSGQKIIGCGMAIKLVAARGYYYLYCPYGPLLVNWNQETIAAIKQFFKANYDKKLLFVRLDAKNMPSRLMSPANPAAATTSALQPRSEWLLDISQSEEDILAGMHQKCRYHIRLSQKRGATARIEPSDPSQLDTFYQLLKTTAARDDFGIMPKANYRAALEILGSDAYLGYVDIDGKPAAAAFCYTYDGQTHYIYGSSSDEYRKLGIGYLLQWRSIQEAKARGAKLYNFGGIAGSVKGDKLAGVTHFKQKFGGFSEDHPLPSDIVINQLGYKLFSAYKRLR